MCAARAVRAVLVVLATGLHTLGLCAQAGNPNPMDSIRKLPTYRPAFDTVTLLSAARIAKLAPPVRREWNAYLQRSRALHTREALDPWRQYRACAARGRSHGNDSP